MGSYEVETECVSVIEGVLRLKKWRVVTANVYIPSLLMSLFDR